MTWFSFGLGILFGFILALLLCDALLADAGASYSRGHWAGMRFMKELYDAHGARDIGRFIESKKRSAL